ncbi:MAG: Bacterial regulatory protein, tetR family [Firmicutes bacterium ADurb.BinA205]|nr:MAG: Bacterial regulatory protein, tetR family [Firmicutes bacterium ADurb.BinA205]
MRSISKIKKYTAAMSELLKSKPLDKVRISEICEMCGTDRQNFYYYFHDKYDLASWIFRLDFIDAMKEKKSYEEDQRIAILEKVRSNKMIYLKLLKDNSQNSLRSYLWENVEKILEYTQKNHPEISRVTDAEKCGLLLSFNEWMESMVLWLDGKYDISLQELAHIHTIESPIELEYIYEYFIVRDDIG